MEKFNLYIRDFYPEAYDLAILHDLKGFLESQT